MSNPNGGTPSPFAARTRAPFPGKGGAPGSDTKSPVPPAVVPAPAPAAPAPAVEKKSSLPLIIGAVVVVGGGVAAFLAMGGNGKSKPGPTDSPAPAVSAVEGPSAPPAPAPAPDPAKRDARKDYEALAKRVASLTLGTAERSDVAAATLQASGGAYAEAVARIGPVVAKEVDATYAEKATALGGIKLEDHSASPAAQNLRLSLAKAAAASKDGIWAEAVASRDEAISLIPEAQAEIAARLSLIAKEAAERKDTDLATYFFEQALRLEPRNEAARSHLFVHKFKAGQTLRAANGMEFAYVPPGEFTRGSRTAEPGRSADEGQSQVKFTGGVFLGATEVTQRQWDQVMGPGAASRTIMAARAKGETIAPDLPMHSVRWDEARAFCEKLSAMDGKRYRLPTEAEWEYACRAGTTTAFNLGGDGLSARDANIDDGSTAAASTLALAGTLGRPNAWGLRDMHGNVWEWCADWSAPYPRGDQVDPTGPAEDVIGSVDLAMKVVRGGGWNAPASDARSANRWEYSPAVTTPYIGFRVVLEPELSSR
jgi:formylglycine-generating enzyme required for sulfatase activity